MKKQIAVITTAVLCCSMAGGAVSEYNNTQMTAEAVTYLSEEDEQLLNDIYTLLSGTPLVGKGNGTSMLDIYTASYEGSVANGGSATLSKSPYGTVILTYEEYHNGTEFVETPMWFDVLMGVADAAKSDQSNSLLIRRTHNGYSRDEYFDVWPSLETWVITDLMVNGTAYGEDIMIGSCEGDTTMDEPFELDSERLKAIGINDMSEIKEISGQVISYNVPPLMIGDDHILSMDTFRVTF